jgi:K+-transporting ATPase ATPase C chain
MLAHIRANAWLLALTVLLCSVVYPAALWIVGQTAFRDHANGSLIFDKEGKPIASRLIAHEVKGDEYFQPRPSAVSYNGAASGASNYGANNYLLRDRVARSLAPLAKYGRGPQQGQPVAPDVVKWFRETPNLVETWATAHSAVAQAWVKAEDAAKDYVRDWFEQRPAELDMWKAKNADKPNPEPEDLAVAFFASFSRQYPATWLSVVEERDKDGKTTKKVTLVKKEDEDSADIAAVFFDQWRDAHPTVELADVPADLVTASGSGLDPHLTLSGAWYQLPRVAAKWSELTGVEVAAVRHEIEDLLHRHAHAPMHGLAGIALVNVVEVNIELHNRYAGKVRAK